MRTDTYTKVVLTVICLALLSMTSMRWTTSGATVRAATPTVSAQKWEYKGIVRTWDFTHVTNSLGFSTFNWNTPTCYDDGQKFDCTDGLVGAFNRLGAQGWELVTAEPRVTWGPPYNTGLTNEESYLFKRPKS
jgi:hypothetical protein